VSTKTTIKKMKRGEVMDDLDRFKAYSAMTEASRKWVSVMDTKAGFISALCGSVIVFIWTGAKLSDVPGTVRYLALLATVMALIALVLSLRVVLPRITLRQAFGQRLTYSESHKPISFFGYVADTYPAKEHKTFVEHVDAMNAKELAREALEQHYTICHVLQQKSKGVALAGWVWLFSVAVIAAALIAKG
jgi:hypothetical protein